MNHLDELLLQYPTCKASVRSFILVQLLDAAPDPTQVLPVELCWAEAADPAAPVRGVARYVLGQLLPRRLALELGAHGGDSGTASLRALAETLDAVTAALDSPAPAVKVAASLVLGRLSTRRAVDRLLAGFATDPSLAATLAELGAPAALDAVVAAVERSAEPDLLLVARTLPAARAVPLLADREPRTDARGRAHIAVALATHPPELARPLIAKLIERREGYTTAHAMDTLAGWGDPADAGLIERVFAQESHEVVRLHALRAAGVIGGDRSLALCRAAFREPSPRVAAAALEALFRIDPEADELTALAHKALASPSARLRAMACRILCASDPDAVDAPLEALVNGPAAERSEGLFLLGQLDHPTSAKRLAQVAEQDPDPALRVDAARALARMPAASAAPAIAGLFRARDPAVVRAVCRALPVLERRKQYTEALGDAAAEPGPARAALIAGLGSLVAAGDASLPVPLAAALSGDDVPALIGALEGLKHAGDRLPVEAVRRLTRHADPRVRARAAQASFLAGELEALGPLAELTAASDDDLKLTGLEAFLDVGLMLAVAAPAGLCKRLLAKMDPAGARPDDATGFSVPLAPDAGAERRARAAERPASVVKYDGRALGAAPVPRPPKPAPAPPPATRSPAAGVAFAVVFGLIVSIALFARPAPAPPPRPSGFLAASGSGLRVWTVVGPCRSLRPGWPDGVPALGQPLAPGDGVETGPGGKLVLRDRAGNAVTLGPESRVTVRAPLALELAGQVALDFKAEPAVEVRYGGQAQRLRHAAGQLANGELTLSTGEGAKIP